MKSPISLLYLKATVLDDISTNPDAIRKEEKDFF